MSGFTCSKHNLKHKDWDCPLCLLERKFGDQTYFVGELFRTLLNELEFKLERVEERVEKVEEELKVCIKKEEKDGE